MFDPLVFTVFFSKKNMVTNKVADISTAAAKGGCTEYVELGPSRWCKRVETWVDDTDRGHRTPRITYSLFRV